MRRGSPRLRCGHCAQRGPRRPATGGDSRSRPGPRQGISPLEPVPGPGLRPPRRSESHDGSAGLRPCCVLRRCAPFAVWGKRTSLWRRLAGHLARPLVEMGRASCPMRKQTRGALVCFGHAKAERNGGRNMKKVPTARYRHRDTKREQRASISRNTLRGRSSAEVLVPNKSRRRCKVCLPSRRSRQAPGAPEGCELMRRCGASGRTFPAPA